MNKLTIIFIFIISLGWPYVSSSEEFLPDEPEIGCDLSVPYQAMDSYNQALGIWKTAEDINKWVARNFKYEKERAIKLSSNQKMKNTGIPIHNPIFLKLKLAFVSVLLDLALKLLE